MIYSLFINFNYEEFKKSFLNSNSINKIFSREELNEIIFLFENNQLSPALNDLNDIISPTTPESAELIANHLLK